MNARVFFDTDILIYAFVQDRRATVAEKLLAAGGVVSVQVLNEFVAVAGPKLGMPWSDMLAALEAIRTLCPDPIPLTLEIHEAGVTGRGKASLPHR